MGMRLLRRKRSDDTSVGEEPLFLFDRSDAEQALIRDEQPRLRQRLLSFLRSRYAILALAFLVAGSAIFVQTTIIQFGTTAAAGLAETRGIPRQMTVKAPRGDILDAGGNRLAWSRAIHNLSIAKAGLDDPSLNAMLLDLSLFLEEKAVVWTNKLADYLMLDHSRCAHADGAGSDCGEPVFVAEIDKILAWQGSDGLFGLRQSLPGEIISYNDNRQMHSAPLFYQYLLFRRFRIEDPTSGQQRYTRSEAYRIMSLRYLILENAWQFDRGQPVPLAEDVPEDVIRLLSEQNYRFRGLVISQDYKREYTDQAQLYSHVLGYVGAINARQYDEWQRIGYSLDAVVGQAGVEYSAERYLAGQDGVRPYNVWTGTDEDSRYYPESIGRAATRGNDVRLTIDPRLQEVARASMIRTIEEIKTLQDERNKGDADAGALVMLDVRSGAVLAMLSYPDYDPHDFLADEKSDPQAAARLASYATDTVNKPLWNRAIMEHYAPGSTFKPLTAVAGLETGKIAPGTNTITCLGHEDIGGLIWKCLEKPNNGHGPLTLTQGLATSCNLYFMNLGVRTGIDQIDAWAQRLNLGEYTGIDLAGETRGVRPNKSWKKRNNIRPGDQQWFVADTCQTAIGQFANSYSVIQLAVYTAGLATGSRITPHVIDRIVAADGTLIRSGGAPAVPIGMSPATLDEVRRGMIAVTSSNMGNASEFFVDFPIKVAAKTGTAETGQEDRSSSNGLFICYAPADNPQIAIAQIVEKGAWGKNTISIARDLMAAYFNVETAENPENPENPTEGLTDNLENPNEGPTDNPENPGENP